MSYCTYCGSPYGETRDHILPVSFTSFKRHYSVGEIVPACFECNNTLSNKILPTVQERSLYLLAKYETKYRKLINFPVWEDWELEEMSESFQKTINRSRVEQEIIKERLLNLRLQAGLENLDHKTIQPT